MFLVLWREEGCTGVFSSDLMDWTSESHFFLFGCVAGVGAMGAIASIVAGVAGLGSTSGVGVEAAIVSTSFDHYSCVQQLRDPSCATENRVIESDI